MIAPQTQNVRSMRMPCPESNTKYPGLAYIDPLGALIVVNETDELHKITRKGKKYTIYNKEDEKVFLALKEKQNKNFEITIFNFYGNEVIQVKRKRFRLCWSKALVWAPPGNFVGTVKEVQSCLNTYLVENSFGKTVLKIVADGCTSDVYRIMANNEQIGVISNDWYSTTSGGSQQFGIEFPVDMDICDKAVLIGACFLIGCLKY